MGGTRTYYIIIVFHFQLVISVTDTSINTTTAVDDACVDSHALSNVVKCNNLLIGQYPFFRSYSIFINMV